MKTEAPLTLRAAGRNTGTAFRITEPQGRGRSADGDQGQQAGGEWAVGSGSGLRDPRVLHPGSARTDHFGPLRPDGSPPGDGPPDPGEPDRVGRRRAHLAWLLSTGAAHVAHRFWSAERAHLALGGPPPADRSPQGDGRDDRAGQPRWRCDDSGRCVRRSARRRGLDSPPFPGSAQLLLRPGGSGLR